MKAGATWTGAGQVALLHGTGKEPLGGQRVPGAEPHRPREGELLGLVSERERSAVGAP